MQTPDIIAQLLILGMLILGIGMREDIKDMENGNIERLIREKRVGAVAAAKARAILVMMRKERVS